MVMASTLGFFDARRPAALLLLALFVGGACSDASPANRDGGRDASVEDSASGDGISSDVLSSDGPLSDAAICLAEESCNGLDDDCDGRIDNDCSVSALVAAATGGTITVQGGAHAGLSLTVPPGALAADTEIRIVPRDAAALGGKPLDPTRDRLALIDSMRVFSELIENWQNVGIYARLLLAEERARRGLETLPVAYDLLPAGTTFTKSAELTLPYSSGDLSDARFAYALRVGHWDQDGVARILTPTSISSTTIKVSIDHFSSVGGLKGALRHMHELISSGAVEGVGMIALTVGMGVLGTIEAVTGIASLPSSEFLPLMEKLLGILLCNDYQGTLDTSPPADLTFGDLLAHLAMKDQILPGVLEIPDLGQIIADAQTGQEGALLDHLLAQDGTVSYGDAFERSLELNGGKVFDALMTIHNTVRNSVYDQPFIDTATRGKLAQLGPKLAPMTTLHSTITDTRGAWYHMAGLAALSVFTGNALTGALLSLAEESVISGFTGHFDPGDALSNLIASLAGAELADRVAADLAGTCLDYEGKVFWCAPDAPAADQAVQVHLDCGKAIDHVTDATGAFSGRVAIESCKSIWMGVTAGSAEVSSQPLTIPFSGAAADLGSLELAGKPGFPTPPECSTTTYAHISENGFPEYIWTQSCDYTPPPNFDCNCTYVTEGPLYGSVDEIVQRVVGDREAASGFCDGTPRLWVCDTSQLLGGGGCSGLPEGTLSSVYVNCEVRNAATGSVFYTDTIGMCVINN